MITHDANDHHLVAHFEVEGYEYKVYILQPGEHFDRFGGSSSGLLVHKTPSLIVSEISNMGRRDTEYDVHDRNAWQRIFRAHADPKCHRVALSLADLKA